MSANTSVKIHPITRRKLNLIVASKPAWNHQTIFDEALDALAAREGIDIEQASKIKARPPQPSAA
jgi:hypothetical protein